MKKILSWSVAVLLVLISIGVAGYPFISDYFNSIAAQNEKVGYLSAVSGAMKTKINEDLESARRYNESLIGSDIYGDAFTEKISESEEYESQLNIEGTDVMAAVRIPKINADLPIYHGTSSEVLSKGIGHLSTSSLPVGGIGTHCVLTGHTGFYGQRLFSDLDRLEVGDIFYITCLDESMAYKVDQIRIVLPENTEFLQLNPDEDYVTLVTCAPFGINTHRLLVRGTRIEIDEAKALAINGESSDSTWNKEYIKAIMLGIAVMGFILLIFILIRFFVYLRRKSKING